MQDPVTSPDSTSPAPADPARQPGRPPVLGADQRKRLISLINAGCSRRVAARAVGCAPSTIANTARRDLQFAGEITVAETNLEADLVKAVRNAAKVDRHWRAASWLLERKFPADYAPHPPERFTVEQISEIFDAVFATIRSEFTPEQCQRVVQKLDSILAAMTCKLKTD